MNKFGTALRHSQVIKNYYNKLDEQIKETNLLPKEEVIKLLSNNDYKKFLGKSGNRKLIKQNMALYKSIMEHGKEYNNFLTLQSFSAYLTIAGEFNYKIPRECFCRCGKRICWDATKQVILKKGYCKKCHITPNRKEHFKYVFGDGWEEAYNNYHNSPRMQKIYKEKGRKLIELKLERGIIGFINKGFREKEILDYYETQCNIKIDRDFKVLNYFPDGYCKETNTVYEVYEFHHFYPAEIQRDLIRQQQIQKELKCNFVIIYDNRDLNIDNLQITTYANS